MRIFRKLAQLLDVDLTTNAPADGDALTYDSGSSKWVPGAGGGGGGAPTDVDYLVGTASGDLSAEIVVGTAPGGELGGTWATPTVDTTHSGSSHASVQAAAEATAAAALSSHASDTTGIHGIADTSALLDTGDIGSTVEAHDTDLTTIAGLSPTNDDVLQRKAGSWVNRTMAQLIADLAALGTTFASLASFNDHSARHENGGADEISVAGLSGQLADSQPSDATLFDSGASTDGQVLTSDGAGGAAWEDAAAGGGGTFTVDHSSDVPPSSANAMDDEFGDSSLDAKWSWRNQGGASWAEFDGWGQLTAPQNSGQSLRSIVQTVSGTFDIRAKVSFMPHAKVDYYLAGLSVWNNSSGKGYFLALFQNLSAFASGMWVVNSNTSLGSNLNEVSSGTAAWLPGVRYMRFVNDGTNIIGYMSVDGRNWRSLGWTAALATHISSIDRIGITMDNENSGNGDEWIVAEWFRRIS